MKLPLGKILPAALALVIGAGATFGATRFLSSSGEDTAEAAPAAIKKKEKAHAEIGIMYPMKERIINLADGGVMRYLKIVVVLEIGDPKLKELPQGEEYKKAQDKLKVDLGAEAPIIEDQLTAILSAKLAADLMKPEGKQALKEEIKQRINKVLGEEKVLGVYFSDFIIQ